MGKINSVHNVLMTNICHLKVRKHITSPIEWLLQQLRRQYQHSQCHMTLFLSWSL